jgi:hypothetical protein
MLRITIPSSDDDPRFVLEGRLAGDQWVEELIRVIQQIRPRKKCVFDIENVFYVDSLGEETLLWLNRLGATFITKNAYGKDLCLRLHLRRAGVRSGAKTPAAENGSKALPSAP